MALMNGNEIHSSVTDRSGSMTFLHVHLQFKCSIHYYEIYIDPNLSIVAQLQIAVNIFYRQRQKKLKLCAGFNIFQTNHCPQAIYQRCEAVFLSFLGFNHYVVNLCFLVSPFLISLFIAI